MVKYCILCGRLPDNIATHRFPIGAHRVEWMAYVERQDNLAQVTESSTLCSRYFNPHDYNVDAVRSLLNRRAILTINAVEEWRHINQQQNMLVKREVIIVELVIVQPDEEVVIVQPDKEVVIVQPDDLPLPQGNWIHWNWKMPWKLTKLWLLILAKKVTFHLVWKLCTSTVHHRKMRWLLKYMSVQL